ncbi:hypothetical protein PCLA_07f0373 [Pseudomonas citronellolis]|nr:hypothetical protein PCLA_07f0373 [Pseudomonas citronellolis]
MGEIEVLQKRLEQNKAQLLVAIESIESKGRDAVRRQHPAGAGAVAPRG